MSEVEQLSRQNTFTLGNVCSVGGCYVRGRLYLKETSDINTNVKKLSTPPASAISDIRGLFFIHTPPHFGDV